MTSRVCASCDKALVAASLCSRCKRVRYCGQACQRVHWQTHKATCTAAPVAASSAPAKHALTLEGADSHIVMTGPGMDHVCPSHACPQHLYSDALHSIFRLLSLSDTVPVLATCKHWLDACRSERKGRGLTICPTKHRLVGLSRSFLRHHASCISSPVRGVPSYGPAALPLLAQLPSLTSASITLDILEIKMHSKRHAQDLGKRLPPFTTGALQQLTIAASHQGLTPAKQMVLETIARMQSLTALNLDMQRTERLQLAPLQSLIGLRSLQLRNVQFHAANVATLQRFPALECLLLHVDTQEPPFVDALLTPPHSLSQLRHVEFIKGKGRFSFSAQTMRLLLVSCPQLEVLKPTWIAVGALPLLASFVHLHTIKVSTVERYHEHSRIGPDLPSILACRAVTDLTLAAYALRGRDLKRLVAGLPGLRALSLTDSSVTTLAPLRSLAHLSSLSVLDDVWFSFAKLCTLAPMPQLRSLRIQLDGNKFRSERTVRHKFPHIVDLHVEQTCERWGGDDDD